MSKLTKQEVFKTIELIDNDDYENSLVEFFKDFYTKCGYTTELKKPFNSSNNIKDVIHIRKRNLQSSLDKIEYEIKYYGNIEK